MAYCTVSDVKLVINTTLTDDQITGIIEMSDAEIDKRIGAQTEGDKLIKKLSMLITAHVIKTRQPKSQAIGEYREDSGNVLEVWEREIERIYRLYKTTKVKGSDYRHIDEDKRYLEG
jgi:glutamate synthase domain-containing protein 3